MRSETLPVKNVLRLSTAGEQLVKRASGVPAIGVIYGATGYGKTTAVDWYCNKTQAVYVRARASWTPASMVGSIAKELRLPPGGSCDNLVEKIIERLSFSNRPLFIDEADYVVDSKKMTEMLRDIHDVATVPVVLIGMAKILQKLQAREQFTGRILKSVEFFPLDMDDARKVAKLCEVEIREDLLVKVHADAKGACRNIIVSLSEAERIAQARGLNAIGLAELGGKATKLFTGAAPAPAIAAAA